MERDRTFRSISRPEKFELSTGGSTFLGLEKSNFVLSTIKKKQSCPAPEEARILALSVGAQDTRPLLSGCVTACTHPSHGEGRAPCVVGAARQGPDGGGARAMRPGAWDMQRGADGR